MKSKTNKNASLLVEHEAMPAILAEIALANNGTDDAVALETVAGALRKTFFPKGIKKVAKSFKKAVDGLCLNGEGFVKKTIRSLEQQKKMGVEKARLLYQPFHDVLLAAVAGVNTSDKTAPVQMRILLRLMDVTDIPPTSAMSALSAVLSHKAIELDITAKKWTIGPMTGLQHRMETAITVNGHAPGTWESDPTSPSTGGWRDTKEITDEQLGGLVD